MKKDYTLEYFRLLLGQSLKTYLSWLTNAQGKEQTFIRDAMIAMGSD